MIDELQENLKQKYFALEIFLCCIMGSVPLTIMFCLVYLMINRHGRYEYQQNIQEAELETKPESENTTVQLSLSQMTNQDLIQTSDV